jgi:hypothetical protein
MRDKHQACQAEDEKTTSEESAVIQTELQQVRVALLYRVKAALEGVMDAGENAAFLFLFGVLILARLFFHQVHD